MSKDIKILQEIIHNTYEQERSLEYQIKQIKKLRQKKELELWNTCKHNWIFDINSNFDDPCKTICTKCNLYKLKRYYE